MKRIVVIDRVITEEGNFVELTHNSAEEGRVYRVEVQDGDAHFYEHYNSLDGELNKRLAHDKFDEFVSKFASPKVRA
jgi:capsule polysaccharide modification protein KpsS